MRFRSIPATLAVLLGLIASWGATAQAHDHGRNSQSFLASLAPAPSITANITPANGDANPYGVAVVPHGFPSGGTIHAGDILVSNFNNGAGLQGTGTTIEAVAPSGQVSTFFSAPSSLGPVGLTTALVALRSGIVVVGNTPTTDGTPATLSDGGLIFLDRSGNVLLNLTSSSLLQGPWDMTADDMGNRASLFVSDVLSGTITEVDLRIDGSSGNPIPAIAGMTQIAANFVHRTDPAALLVGPTGLLLARGHDGNDSHRHGRHDHARSFALYVASTGSDSIFLIRGHEFAHDTEGTKIVSGGPLEGPLALAWAPNGDIIASNGDAAGPPQTASNINRVVEIDPRTHSVVDTRQLDTSGTPGAIFGIAVDRVNGRPSLIYVNDNTATLSILPSN